MLTNRHRRPRRLMLAGVAVAALVAAPLGAQRAGSAITPAEAQQGAEYHQQLLNEFGGAMAGTQASYVEQIGKNIAIQSGLANSQSAFTVTLLNSSVDNAFAIPGGYVYVTRQLVSLMNNEAELAGVLGHEVGHVAARHSKSRERAAQRNSILGVLGSVLAGAVLGNSALGQLGQQVFSAAPELLTAKYSRKQETEADTLGIRYLKGAGYDPRAMATLLQSLAALTRLDGLIYGDDPQQGMIEGNTFVHPDLKLTFSVPNGYYMINGTDAVSINGQGGQAQFAT